MTRTLAATVFAAIGAVSIWFGGWWTLGFAMIMGAVMVWEWRGIARRKERTVIAGFQIVAVVGATYLAFAGRFDVALAFLVVIAVVGALIDAALHRQPWWNLVGVIYIGLALCFFVVIRQRPDEGLQAIIWLILIVVATDTGAYFAGRSLGGPKLWPRVSPGKTWSGAIGGVVAAAVMAWAIGALAGRPLMIGAEATAIFVSIVSQGGDLLESAYKRRFGVKDSGSIMPGHGGALDRMDGLLAASLAVGIASIFRPGSPVWAW
ncbi:MAG: phosphatidate cytidylyltransferase [Pseudomonadota bacterium]